MDVSGNRCPCKESLVTAGGNLGLSIVRFSDPVAFRDRVLPKLLEAEAENCRIISLAIALAEKGIAGSSSSPRLWTVENDHGVDLVIIQKLGELLEVSRGSTEGANVLVASLCRDGDVRAIAGVCPTIAAIASNYADHSSVNRTLYRRYRARSLTEVLAPAHAGGAMRCGKESDRQILSEFIDAYMHSINEPPYPDSGKVAADLIAAKRIFFWCDPQAVAMAAWAGPTPNGIRINSVFTAADYRNCGYASNLVAALTQRLLDEGRRSCFLFTDSKNPGAEHVYARIGYKPVSHGEHWTFERPTH